MKSLLIATSNPGKITEFNSLLGTHFECVAADQRAPDVEEDGTNYFENAEKKARAFFGVYQTPVLSDDSGLEVDALKGAPGLYSARYGGTELSWPKRWSFLYSQIPADAPKPWTARFRAVLCYFDGKKAHFFESTVDGWICSQAKGEKGFGYDPIFFSSELKKTFGEATAEEKGRVSHRARAAKLFLDWTSKNRENVT